MNFVGAMVIISLALCVVFAAVVLIFNFIGIEVSDTLIDMFYRTFGVEIGAAALLQIVKYRTSRAKRDDEVKAIKKEGFEVEKEDLKITEENDDFYEGRYYNGE